MFKHCSFQLPLSHVIRNSERILGIHSFYIYLLQPLITAHPLQWPVLAPALTAFDYVVATLQVGVAKLVHQALLDDGHFGVLVKHVKVAFSDVFFHDVTEIISTKVKDMGRLKVNFRLGFRGSAKALFVMGVIGFSGTFLSMLPKGKHMV